MPEVWIADGAANGRAGPVHRSAWGCSTFPVCGARVGVAPEPVATSEATEWVQASPGQSAQQEFERFRQRNRERIRRQWPFAIGITLVVIVVIYLIAQSWVPHPWPALAAALVALALLSAFVESPKMDAWRTGAEGERKTGHHLDGLREAGFVVLHDRKVPGYGDNLDHVVIGPSGVWAVQTKNVAGKIEIAGDSLRIRGYRQDRMVDQVYREAAAIQVALGTSLAGVGVTVTPVLCIHRGELPFSNKRVRGVRLASGRQLVRLLKAGDIHLTSEQIQTIARAADQVLRPASR